MNYLFSLVLLVLSIHLYLGIFEEEKTPLQEKNVDNSLDKQLIPTKINERWILKETLASFKENQLQHKDFSASGLSKKDYLEVIEGQIKAMYPHQNNEGRIIDPVEKVEKYYSTPCYAHSVAVLAYAGKISDKGLIESGMKALDVSLQDMYNNKVPGDHGDFYTYPVMFAYNLFKKDVAPERLEKWDYLLNNLQPQKLYRQYLSNHNNWNIVNFSGEYLRYKAGFTSLDYVEDCMELQLSHFTEKGMYNEKGNPLPYDLFSRHFLSGVLYAGYRGKKFEEYRELLYKGAWMSLFIQSPFGELPTGYRSSHHIWNEAEQCVIFEIYASALSHAGKTNEAAAFKRAAMLSLQALKNWIRTDGSGYVVKNRFPMEARHGYESYSAHTCYNLLACSMLAQAWQFSDNSIAELPAPADVGGFVIPVIENFHKIFANVNGTYIEYDTNGDQKYNPTGIIRIHIKGSHPQLGPSDGCAELFSGKGNCFAVGPAWQDMQGAWKYLAKVKSDKPIIRILKESSEQVIFQVQFIAEDEVTVIETINISDGKIIVKDELHGKVNRMKVTYPMLISDGKNKTNVVLSGNKLELELQSKKLGFVVTSEKNGKIIRSNKLLNHRNGVVEMAFIESDTNSVTYAIEKP